jgi:transketolase N-terminal domain/subunit
MNLKIEKLKQKAKYLRQQVLEMCVSAGTGHVASCFSCVEIMTAFYYGRN